MDFKFSNHAVEEIERRKIPISFVEAVLKYPQQILEQSKDITIYQSQLDFDTGKFYLTPRLHQHHARSCHHRHRLSH